MHSSLPSSKPGPGGIGPYKSKIRSHKGFLSSPGSQGRGQFLGPGGLEVKVLDDGTLLPGASDNILDLSFPIRKWG